MKKEEFDTLINRHIDNLRELHMPTGLFLASAKGLPTGYDKAWLRDNFYEVLAFERIGDWEAVRKTWRAILQIFLKHHDKIDWAAKQKPYETWQYIHARYNPENFEEYWEEWGNKQNDAVGAVLYKIADLELKGYSVIESDDEYAMLQTLVDYLNSIEYWHDPDNGVWEENEEVHTSSIGAVVAALKKLNEIPQVHVPEHMLERGEEALRQILPRESEGKFVDMAQLSLIYPYDLLDDDMEKTILNNLEYHLSRRMGVVRYKNDRYYNNNPDGYSEEAEWTMGLAWLAIIFAQRANIPKALQYLSACMRTATGDGKLPELYLSNTTHPNENTPLGWAESMMIIALKDLEEHIVTKEESQVQA